jgi:hypothetical protein
MNPWFRRLQLISTGLMVPVSLGLLVFGYLAATTPEHSATEAVVLFALAVAIPPLIYGLWSLIRWIDRGRQPSADPSSLAARIGRKRYVGFVPIVIMLGVLKLSTSVGMGSSQSEPEAAFARMRRSCVQSASSSLKQHGADPTAAKVKAKIDKYCSCVVVQVQVQYTPAELERVSSLGRGAPEKDEKLGRLLESCARQSDDL